MGTLSKEKQKPLETLFLSENVYTAKYFQDNLADIVKLNEDEQSTDSIVYVLNRILSILKGKPE